VPNGKYLVVVFYDYKRGIRMGKAFWVQAGAP
jgi:hypothetical protein